MNNKREGGSWRRSQAPEGRRDARGSAGQGPAWEQPSVAPAGAPRWDQGDR